MAAQDSTFFHQSILWITTAASLHGSAGIAPFFHQSIGNSSMRGRIAQPLPEHSVNHNSGDAAGMHTKSIL
jgi:hypothetical protein